MVTFLCWNKVCFNVRGLFADAQLKKYLDEIMGYPLPIGFSWLLESFLDVFIERSSAT